MAPTKQAKGDSVKEPKLHQRQNGERNLGRNQAQSGASSPLTNKRTVYDYDSGSITGQKSDWIGAFRIFVFTVGSGHVFSRPIQTSQWCLFIFFTFFYFFTFYFLLHSFHSRSGAPKKGLPIVLVYVLDVIKSGWNLNF